MATLQISFSGLCAFVPRVTDAQVAVDVLLVNASHARAKKLSKVPARHSPLLQFDLANLKGGFQGSGSAQGIWTLQDEDIDFDLISTDALPQTGVTLQSKGPQGSTPAPGEEGDLKWLPRVEKILPGEGSIDPAFMAGFLASDGPVVARIHLRGGALGTARIGTFNKQFIVTHFVPTDVRQALASKVVNSYQLPQDCALRIRSHSSADQQSKREVILIPQKNDAGEDVIKIDVTNLCTGFFGAQRDKDSDGLLLPEPDDDFETFYMLCQNFVPAGKSEDAGDYVPFDGKFARLPIPIPTEYPLLKPLATALEPDGGGIDPIRCSMTQFEAFSG